MALSPAQRLADSREKDETLSALVACITAAGLSLDDKQLKTIEDWISSEGITGTALASAFTGTIVPKLHGLSYSVSLAIFAAFRGESIGGAGNRAGNQQFVIPNSNNTPDTPNVHHGARIAARSLLDVLGLDFARFQNVHGVPSVDEIVSGTTITGSTEPFAPTPFLVSESITGMNVALGVLANIISKMRFGHTQHVTVNVNHASASLSTHCNMWLDGNHYKQLIRAAAAAQENPHREFMQLFQNTFRAKNGWVYMYQRATDTPEGLLEGLGFPKEDIPRIYQLTKTSSETRHEFLRLLSDKIYSWPSALELEQHMIKLGRGAVVVPKSDEEFRESEHGKIAVNFPPIEILPQEQPGANWLPQPFEKLAGSQGKGPLSGIKVLEVTRILMGPQITCVLAGLGASVLRVSSKQLEDGKTVAMCLNVGKRSVYLDLKSEEGKRIFTSLVADADVVVQNNAYGAMDRLGFGMEGLMNIVKDRKKGIVYVQGNCFGFSGPYATAAGYEHLAQFFSGIAVEQGRYAKYVPPPLEPVPSAIPINILDISTGHAGAIGTIAALLQRAEKGGSYLVNVSLLQSALFLKSLGRHPDWIVEKTWARYQPDQWPIDPDSEWVGVMGYFLGFQGDYYRKGNPQGWLDENHVFYQNSHFGGTLKIMKHPLQLSDTPMRWRVSPRPFGHDSGALRWLSVDEEEDVEEVAPNVFSCKSIIGTPGFKRSRGVHQPHI